MSDFKNLLNRAFKGQPPEPTPPMSEAPAPAPPAPRYFSNLRAGALAQRFYDPGFEAQGPRPKRGAQEMEQTGTGSAMDMTGPWGEPKEVQP